MKSEDEIEEWIKVYASVVGCLKADGEDYTHAQGVLDGLRLVLEDEK